MTTVTLIDGREVDSASEEWRHETEARMVARMPSTAQRHDYIAAVMHQRGRDAAQELKALATRIRQIEVLGRADA